MNTVKHITTDFLVIGSGVAGLYFSNLVSSMGEVLIITKSDIKESSTYLAQGGVASVQSPDDSVKLHVEDTLGTGGGLSRENVVRSVVEFGEMAADELLSVGVSLDIQPGSDRDFELGLEGGHSRNRILHVADATGKAIQEAYMSVVRDNPKIEILKNHTAIDFLTQHNLPDNHPHKKKPIQCWGAYVLDNETGVVKTITAKIVLLASGGCGRLYRYTTNPQVATADGLAMAYRAGATVSNLEFIQFHPTMFYDLRGEGFLITEALRGEGAKLRNRAGKRIMEGVHRLEELAPRDIVARAIDAELKATGEPCVFLDITHRDKDYIKSRFPNIHQHCLERGVNITSDWIPVVPAAHYMCGGIKVDMHARTGIKNLLAAGEVTCTGMHGANRLASNSLLEAMAYAYFAYKTAREIFESTEIPELPDWDDSGVFDRREWVIVRHVREVLTRLMWDYVGIARSDDRLEAARRRVRHLIEEIDNFYRENPVSREVLELRNLATAAMLVIRSALQRPESRGLHYNIDHPETDICYNHDTDIKSSRIWKEVHIDEGIVGTA